MSAGRFVFVGERRSQRAIAMNVTWVDGHLAACTLFRALRSLGIEPMAQVYLNAYTDDGALNEADLAALPDYHREGRIVVALGQVAQRVVARLGLPHRCLVHPAARGTIRLTERYQVHVAEVLVSEGEGDQA